MNTPTDQFSIELDVTDIDLADLDKLEDSALGNILEQMQRRGELDGNSISASHSAHSSHSSHTAYGTSSGW